MSVRVAQFAVLASVFVTTGALAQTPQPVPGPGLPPNTPVEGASPPPGSPTPANPPPAPAPAPDATAAPAPAAAPADADHQKAADFTTLRILREKNVITEEEYQAALHDLGEPMGMRAGEGNTFVFGKWATTLYGFAEADVMYHSTESFNDFAGNAPVAKQGTYPGDNSRMTFSGRDSRFGVRVKTPAPKGYSFTANLEGDFLGSEPGIYQNSGGTAPVAGSTNTEAGFFVNPAFRIRHAFFKAETPVLDFTVGQTWNLLGWQAVYIPTIVQWPGLVGELYGRSPQVRLGKTLKSDATTFEVAAGAFRPPQRDSGVPAFQGGLRLAIEKWKTAHTSFMTSTTINPLSIAVTGDVRSFRVPEFAAAPTTSKKKTGTSVAFDAFVPIVPGTKKSMDNALAVTAELVFGQGIADQYTGMYTGIANPALPKANPTDAAAPAFPARVDPNLVAYDGDGNLRLIKTRSYFINGEYYLPGVDGRLAIFGGYYSMEITNPEDFGAAATTSATVRKKLSMIDVGAFVDATANIRIGMDYANFRDDYNDGTRAKNWGVQTSGFFFF